MEHVYVSTLEMGRRHLLRTQPSYGGVVRRPTDRRSHALDLAEGETCLVAMAQRGGAQRSYSSGRVGWHYGPVPFAGSDLHTACMSCARIFCLIIAMTVFTSPQWKRGLPSIGSHAEASSVPTLCAATTAAVYVQLILGALMRHTAAGLAI